MQITSLYTGNQYYNSNIQNKNNKWFVSQPSLNFKANPELTKQLTDTFHKTINSGKLTDEAGEKLLATITSSIPVIASGVATSYGSKNKAKSYDPNYYLNQRDKNGDTELTRAAKHVDINRVKELLKDKNVDPNIKNKDGDTALMWAAAYGYLDITKELLKHENIDPNIQDKDGDTALMWAAYNGHLDIAKELLKHEKVDPNIQNNINGNTALIWAAKRGHLDVAQELLEHENIDPDIQDKDGKTALDYNSKLRPLIQQRQKEIDRKNFLLNLQAEVAANKFAKENIKTDDLYYTPIYLKVLTNDLNEMAKAKLFNEKSDSYGDSMLCKLASYPMINENNENELKEILNKLDKLDINYNQKDNDGISVFEHIMNSENKIFLDFVIKKGVKFDYYPNLDNRYKQIEDKDFKTLLDAHKSEFVDFKDVRDAIKSEDKEAIDAVKPQMTSPFFDITQYI